MRVLALVPSQKGYSPGQRGSIELWEKILGPEGIDLEFVPFETDELRRILHLSGRHAAKAFEMMRSYAKRLQLLSKIKNYDAIFVYREAALLGPAFLEKLIARERPIIYQLDDPLFVPYNSPSNGIFSHLKFFGKIKEIIRISKVVIVNSSHIRSYARQFNDNIWQVPSIVDTDKFVFKSFPLDLRRPCVGWSGSPTTIRNIKLLEAPLQNLGQRDICDFHFIGGTDFDIENLGYTSQKWAENTEVADLRKIQIGLVPLPENPWNKYKFIMKTAQYMALGIVPVGTPLASNTEVIKHGESGFLASNDEEWLEYLTILATDSKLRNEMSKVAAADALQNYSLIANAPKIIKAFRSALK
jgi:glycosyltransferase involved in cell wall biosynthesis